ncbi:MAG: hypothetical protein ACRD5K_07170 [Candidatus Acidiferrales bacterium]
MPRRLFFSLTSPRSYFETISVVEGAAEESHDRSIGLNVPRAWRVQVFTITFLSHLRSTVVPPWRAIHKSLVHGDLDLQVRAFLQLERV